MHTVAALMFLAGTLALALALVLAFFVSSPDQWLVMKTALGAACVGMVLVAGAKVIERLFQPEEAKRAGSEDPARG